MKYLCRLHLLTIFLITLPAARAESLLVNVTNGDGKPLAGTVVYAMPNTPIEVPALERTEIEQRNKEFHPFISVIPVGTTTYFPNRDGIGHHVYSFSQTKTFELPLSEKILTVPVKFDTPGIVTVGCNIHDWMVAYIYIVDTPYYGLTSNDGQVNIDDIPPGQYQLHIRHPGMNSDDVIEQQLILSPDSSRSFEFIVNIKPEYLWKPAHPPENEEEFY